MSIKFSYYYGKEAEQFSFFRIPKLLFTDKTFSNLSSDAKVLYGILLDRMSLSMKNGWLDEENKVFIIFTVDEIEETMNIGKNKAINIMKEIQEFGLIEKKRRGLGKPNIIYVKSFLVETIEENGTVIGETDTDRILNGKSQEVLKANLQKFEKQTSRNLENKLQEVYKTNPNNTNINNTKKNDTDISNTTSMEKATDMRESRDYGGGEIKNSIKQNIEYHTLLSEENSRKESIDLIVEIMTDALMREKDLRINQTFISYEKIKERFLSLKKEHIKYILCILKENTSNIINLRAYLLSIIYNAPINITYYNKAPQIKQDFGNYADDERLWQEFLKGGQGKI